MLKKLSSPFLALLVAFTTCVYIPAVSFLGNPNEFPFSIWSLLRDMLIPFLCITAGLGLLLFVVEKSFAKASGASSSTEDADSNILTGSPLHVVVLLLVFCVWLEGFVLNRGLPQLTGEMNIFNSLPRLIVDSAIWFFVLSSGVMLWRFIARHLHLLAPCLGLFLALGIMDAAIASPPQIKAQASSESVIENISFNSKDNVLVIVLDAMSTALVKDFIEANPAAKKELDGFVLFENNLETALSTQWALPSILKGDVFSGGDILKYQQGALDAKEALPERFHAAGYNVYASSILPIFNRLMAGDDSTALTRLAPPIKVTQMLYCLLSVRFAPYAAKNLLANQAGFAVATPLGYDHAFYAKLEDAVSLQRSGKPTFHFHHINGAHKPYVTAQNAEALPSSEKFTLNGLYQQSNWTLNSIIKLLKHMKDEGIYDVTTIVLLGDHGDRMLMYTRKHAAYSARAALLIKPAGRTAPFMVSSAPTSNMYVAGFVSALHLEHKSLDTLTSALPHNRYTYDNVTEELRTFTGVDVKNLQILAERKVQQTYTPTVLEANRAYTFSILDKNMLMAFPLAVEDTSIDGWGVKFLADSNKVSFKTKGLSKLNLDIVLETAAEGGGEDSFDAYPLVVQDLVTGKESYFTITNAIENIQLNAVQTDASANIRLCFKLKQFSSHNIRIKRLQLNSLD